MIRAMARRVGASDLDELAALWEVRAEADAAISAAIDALRGQGISWGRIGAAAGLTAQGAHQWRKRRVRQPSINTQLMPEPREGGAPW